ncbi:hypothetical protein GCM10022225_00400 [Plantactinospora mayteni]|uniref:4Fe-4S Wbl-type domain-containing protein n=1 Tax=Plantactinospora mayteni TaxID=566021 RepID=A0ABQ4EYN0_9ACTN|nr:hypothetical protein [Plantactinospora mayteni]GIG99732.1 hypothetical protein Pma05_63050 [Plantactinospora mayteni]
MNGHESAPGLAADWAWATITNHAESGHCGGCRGTWCPTAEWALWVVITDRIVPADRRTLVTVVARQVMTAHWPRGVDGCRPCGLPDCGRMALAATWLEVVRDDYLPPSVDALRPTMAPTDEDLRRITGMD